MKCIPTRLPIFVLEFVVLGVASLLAQSSVTINLTVDATRAPEKILHTRMVMPVKPGPLTLYYPKWIPGFHDPSGPVGDVGGLTFSANGKTLPWRRDLLDGFTFHVDVPPGVDRLEVEFDYIQPGNDSATDKLVIVAWNPDVLYPAGVPPEKITFNPTLRLPLTWKFGTPLPVENAAGNEVTFKPVSLNTLVDSPVIAGEYYRAVDVTPPHEPVHHEIDLVADSAAALEMTPEMQKGFTNMVAEAGKLFGARHYRDYHFLLTLSDHVAHFGLEHHECNDSRTAERDLLTPAGRREVAGLLGHEFVHSWNGKFRRPADLSTPDFEAPMKTDLLWIYEGLTSYLGPLLAARSGLWTPEEYREDLATTAADMGPGRPGRTWRPLQDTADAVASLSYGRGGWVNWRRSVDYYPEGDLLWLEVATLIHDQTQGQKSFENFCQAFYGGPNQGPELKPYPFDDLVQALQAVAPYDWAGFFHNRLTAISAKAPVGGIEAGGWKVDYTDKPPESPGGGAAVNAIYSLGLRIGTGGAVQDSLFGGPAYQAGIVSGMRVAAVNDRAYTPDLLNDALKASTKNDQPIRFLVLNDDYYRTCSINYHGGERFPHLVRVEGKPDLLDDIAKPLAREK
ncbi:MAG: M61 family peptidase [Terriglobia bacterium]|jgi:predicted metalloprotease with PDZ domain